MANLKLTSCKINKDLKDTLNSRNFLISLAGIQEKATFIEFFDTDETGLYLMTKAITLIQIG